MTAQILLVFEKLRFLLFFSFLLSKNRYKKITELQFLNSIVGCCQVNSGVANL